jgi:site-specific recombinase XerC
MINRQNWIDTKDYLAYLERIDQLSIDSIKRARTHLRHLIEWADETALPSARTIDPTFPSYLLKARMDGQEKPLASASIIKCLQLARRFFEFARAEWPVRYKSVSQSWIASLQPARHLRGGMRQHVHQFYSLEDVLKIAHVETETLREERGRAGACMLFLSGMRADALASMPRHCIHLDTGEIEQLPEFGVRTKNRKSATTYLLPIPELLEVVKDWDRRLQSLPQDALWYSPVSTDGMSLIYRNTAHFNRAEKIQQDVRRLCAIAGIPYLTPHKLRHGHVVYALKKSKTFADFKAVSQNVMHASVTITDSIYGGLSGNDVQSIISSLK